MKNVTFLGLTLSPIIPVEAQALPGLMRMGMI